MPAKKRVVEKKCHSWEVLEEKQRREHWDNWPTVTNGARFQEPTVVTWFCGLTSSYLKESHKQYFNFIFYSYSVGCTVHKWLKWWKVLQRFNPAFWEPQKATTQKISPNRLSDLVGNQWVWGSPFLSTQAPHSLEATPPMVASVNKVVSYVAAPTSLSNALGSLGGQNLTWRFLTWIRFHNQPPSIDVAIPESFNHGSLNLETKFQQVFTPENCWHFGWQASPNFGCFQGLCLFN